MRYLYTKDQLIKVLEGWGVEECLPKKHESYVVAFPPPAALNHAVITCHPVKGEYNCTLYAMELTRQ